MVKHGPKSFSWQKNARKRSQKFSKYSTIQNNNYTNGSTCQGIYNCIFTQTMKWYCMACFLYQHRSANFYVGLQQKHSSIARIFSTHTLRIICHNAIVRTWTIWVSSQLKKSTRIPSQEAIALLECQLLWLYVYIYINAHRTTTTCNLFVPFFFWGGDNFQKKVFSQSKNRGHRRVPGILLHIITTYWKLAWNPLLKVRVPGIITKPGIVPGYYPPRN